MYAKSKKSSKNKVIFCFKKICIIIMNFFTENPDKNRIVRKNMYTF